MLVFNAEAKEAENWPMSAVKPLGQNTNNIYPHHILSLPPIYLNNAYFITCEVLLGSSEAAKFKD